MGHLFYVSIHKIQGSLNGLSGPLICLSVLSLWFMALPSLLSSQWVGREVLHIRAGFDNYSLFDVINWAVPTLCLDMQHLPCEDDSGGPAGDQRERTSSYYVRLTQIFC